MGNREVGCDVTVALRIEQYVHTCSQLHTLVLGTTQVLAIRSESHRRRNGKRQQLVGCALYIIIVAHGETVEYVQVESYVVVLCLLPFQVVIRQSYQIRSHPIVVSLVLIVTKCGKSLIRIKVLRTGITGRCTQLELSQPTSVFHKMLFMQIPTDTCRPKSSPTLVFTES